MPCSIERSGSRDVQKAVRLIKFAVLVAIVVVVVKSIPDIKRYREISQM